MTISLFLLSLVHLTFIQYIDPAKLVSAEASSDKHFNFVAAGDWGCGHEAQNTFAIMEKMEPELYLGLGDYSYESTMDCWYDIVKSAGPALKIVLGNHDTEGSLLQSLMNKFELTDQYYSFEYGNAHFLALSTELDSVKDAEQFDFAKEDLNRASSNPNINWIIIYFHRPFYTGGGLDNAGMRDIYHPLFERYDVDLVLQGHAHNYQRSYPLEYNDINTKRPIVVDQEQFQYDYRSGTVFAVVGTGGDSIQGVEKKPFLASTYEGYGCLNVEINDKQLTAEFYSNNGDTIDHFMIMKNQSKGSFDTSSNIHQAGYERHLER